MKRLSSRLRRLLWMVMTAFLLLIGYFLCWHYQSAVQQAEKASLLRLAGIVNSLALQIDGDAHTQLVTKNPNRDDIHHLGQDSLYDQLQRILLRNYEANMLKSPIYTLLVDPAQRTCMFGVTSAEMPYFRHPYASAPDLLFEQYTQRAGAMVPMYRDEFGTWLSAFAVVRNSTGQPVALVQADEKFDAFIVQARWDIVKNLLFSLFVFALLLLLLLWVMQPIIRREMRDKAALTEAYSEIKLLSEQLRSNLDRVTQLDHYRQEMVANISHDLRTPLANILGYLETLEQKRAVITEEQQAQYLRIAHTEAQRLRRLVQELFDLSKLESGQVKLNIEPFNVAELVQDSLQKYLIAAEQQHVQVLMDIAEQVPLAAADIAWIDRVMQNLFDNALRYAGTGGFIKATLFADAHKIHFKVCNSGRPIAEEHLEAVFDRYFQSSNRHEGSTGLGLAIVKRAIEYHGERVWAEVDGEVTTFRFTLPVYVS
jgi:signal transduction histidine kinase